jgi:hypothetical protein
MNRAAVDALIEDARVAEAVQKLDYLTEHQAAALLGMTRARLQKYRLAGKGGPRYRRFGTAVRYRREWLDAWFDAQGSESAPEQERVA